MKRSTQTSRGTVAGLIAHVLVVACTTDVHVADDLGTPAAEATTAPSDTSEGGRDTTGNATANSSSSSSSSGSTGDGPKYDVPSSDTDGPVPIGCIGGNDLIWVLTLNQDEGRRPELYRFDPEDPGLEWEADLDCLPLKLNGDNPLSLGVSRDGRAYLSMAQPKALWSFELLADDPCATVEMIAWNPPGQSNSLAYVALDPAAPDDETMFAHTTYPATLGRVRLDLPEVVIEYVGMSPQPYMTLTGSADGQLFAVAGPDGFGDGALLTIDPTNGATLAELLAVDAGSFPAFFGGDVILFEVNQLGVGLFSPRALRYDADDADGDGEHPVVEIFGAADDPPNLWIRGVASPTCIPVTPEG